MNRALLIGSCLSIALAACGGGGGGSPSTTPPSGGGGGTTPANPCATALLADESEQPMTGMVAGGERQGVSNKTTLVDGDPRGRVLEAMWIHQAARLRQGSGAVNPSATSESSRLNPRVTTGPVPVSEDVGDIAVVQDQGDIVLPANPFDLRNTGLRFTPSGGGYTVTKIDASFRSTLGTRVVLGDDDSAEIDVPFSFSFYGTAQKTAFVNSDGNLTFGEEDKASTDRNVARLLTGPPRVSPFLADLDPTSGGKIFVNAASDQYTMTWCGVLGFGSAHSVTAQATLLPDASIEFKFADTTTLGDAVVGLSPGRTGDFTAADLSVPNPSSGSGAIGERFAQASTLDTIAAAKKFYASHGDTFDQILFWTDQRVITGGAFSYESTVSNEIHGIGQDIYDLSSEFGSGGRLRSVVVMDWAGKFPDDPNQKFLGENNTLSVIGQEVGHRWLAYMNFKDHTGASSDALLGRDLAHWSFFFNSDASVMEGNEIQDLGGGQFKTIDAVKRYSRLDQYAMGLVPPSQVPTMFYVDTPVSNKVREDAPQIGVTFTGTRRDFLIDDVIAVNGQRSPSASDASKTHRQAFLYIVTAGKTADPAQVAKVDTFRKAWEGFFAAATENRMTAVTRLH